MAGFFALAAPTTRFEVALVSAHGMRFDGSVAQVRSLSHPPPPHGAPPNRNPPLATSDAARSACMCAQPCTVCVTLNGSQHATVDFSHADDADCATHMPTLPQGPKPRDVAVLHCKAHPEHPSRATAASMWPTNARAQRRTTEGCTTAGVAVQMHDRVWAARLHPPARRLPRSSCMLHGRQRPAQSPRPSASLRSRPPALLAAGTPMRPHAHLLHSWSRDGARCAREL